MNAEQDSPNEPVLNAAQVQQLLQGLPSAVGAGLHEMLNSVVEAKAPAPFSDALGELEAYLAALEAAGVVPFDQQIQLKAYVMQGWRAWRSSIAPIPAPAPQISK